MADAEIIPIEGRSTAHTKTRCKATTSSGRPCRNYAADATGYCRLHAPLPVGKAEHPSSRPEPTATNDEPERDDLMSRLGGFIKRRLAGDYPIDDFGYDPELAREVMLPFAAPLFERYFRIKTLGIDRIPNEGPALVVSNHSGTVALDALVLQTIIAAKHPNKRALRNVGADLVFRLPFVGPMARKMGNVLACDEDAQELLQRGELVGVFPEGYKGVGKGWSERYKLQRFGRGGFIETALRARVPIIPVAIVGAEEAYPMIAESKFIARTFGFPYFPITPTFPLLGPLGGIPLPSKWLIEFGDPIPMDDYDEDAAEDKMLVFDLADDIRDRIQQMIYRNLRLRGGAFL